MNRLFEKTAIITGAGSGFGAGIAEAFVREGARVIVADIDEVAAQRQAATLGAGAHAIGCDVSSDASVAAMVAAARAWAGRIDVLVNNAGIGHRPQPLDTLAEAEFDRIGAVNMKSVYLTARHLVAHMRTEGGGTILNIASTGGRSPRAGLAWYNASKGWMIAATRAMAIELAPDQIRVNAINPVAGETPLLKTFMGEDTPETRARFLTSIPLGRFSTPADIAAAAVYLCSDEASLVTGVALEVDGGRCI